MTNTIRARLTADALRSLIPRGADELVEARAANLIEELDRELDTERERFNLLARAIEQLHGTPSVAALTARAEAAEAEVERLKRVVSRYLNEVPLGHQPHMLAGEALTALGDKP